MDENFLSGKIASAAFWALPSLIGSIIAAWLHLPKTTIGYLFTISVSFGCGVFLYHIPLEFFPWLHREGAQILTASLTLFIVQAASRGLREINLADALKSWITKDKEL
jgi:hypothetical protein